MPIEMRRFGLRISTYPSRGLCGAKASGVIDRRMYEVSQDKSRYIYRTLAPGRACSIMQCVRLGVSGPDGRRYGETHMIQAAVPWAATPRVRLEFGPRQPTAPASGIGDIPDAVLRDLARRMSEEEAMTAGEIANKLTEDYGALYCAMRCVYIISVGISLLLRLKKLGGAERESPSILAHTENQREEPSNRAK